MHIEFKENNTYVPTSFHNDTIVTSVSKLIDILGVPDVVYNDGSDKVNVEWERVIDWDD